MDGSQTIYKVQKRTVPRAMAEERNGREPAGKQVAVQCGLNGAEEVWKAVRDIMVQQPEENDGLIRFRQEALGRVHEGRGDDAEEAHPSQIQTKKTTRRHRDDAKVCQCFLRQEEGAIQIDNEETRQTRTGADSLRGRYREDANIYESEVARKGLKTSSAHLLAYSQMGYTGETVGRVDLSRLEEVHTDIQEVVQARI